MESIKLQSHVGSDGMLKLEVPVSQRDTDVEVLLLVQPADKARTSAAASPESRGWPPRYFEETAGCLEAEPLLIEKEGPFEAREALR